MFGTHKMPTNKAMNADWPGTGLIKLVWLLFFAALGEWLPRANWLSQTFY
jgi:hypothetical protein